MSQLSEPTPRAAEAQTTLHLQSAERLPAWLYLWLPLLVAVALSLAFHLAPVWFRAQIMGEVAPMEITQEIILLIAVFYAIRTLALAEVRRDRLVFAWILLALLGSVYLVGEEASWGQHYIGWLTPETWQALNDQGETNLHNTSSWLDQKPRTLLELGIIVGGIVIPLLAVQRPGLRQGRYGLFLPPLVCLPVALIGEFAKNWERLKSHGLWDFMVFYRASEVQELYFYSFILFYLIVFRQRVLARRVAGLPARPPAGTA